MGSGGKMDGDEANTMHPAKYSMMGGGHTSGTKLAMAFYGIYGLGFFVALNIVGIYGIGVMPLFPFRIDDLVRDRGTSVCFSAMLRTAPLVMNDHF
eukprot:SAG31_NODE_923_length_10969_cov_6.723091_3_plen_96_part_00